MKASLSWLRALCPSLPEDPTRIATRLTSAGLEVEAIASFGDAAKSCVLASIVSTRPHPARESMRLVTVDPGGARLEVVCGAPELPGAGSLVVLAPLGTHLPAAGVRVERRLIGGVPSEGMLCSEAELGLSDRRGELLVLPPGAGYSGVPLAMAVPSSSDTIFEIGLTPNRPDGLGHIGLARELAALFDLPFDAPFPRAESGPSPSHALEPTPDLPVRIEIEDAERCPRYGAAFVDAVSVKPSPHDVRWRLASLGVRSISNVVDITNLLMLEFGHPLHAFDLDKLRGARIVVRHCRPGEKLRTLDGVERDLTHDDLVICDEEGPLALAGIMGGGSSEISSHTRRVLVECATFDAPGIRRASRRHGLHTESSHRFERGVDWGDTHAVLARATSLLADLANGRPVSSRVVEARKLTSPTVSLRHDRLCTLLGAKVDRAESQHVLRKLGFELRAIEHAADRWVVPSFRPDVSREVDLIEEVARVHGYDAIPAVLPRIRASRDGSPRQSLARRMRDAAVGIGLSEAVCHSFVAPKDLDAVDAPKPTVTLRNPLNEEQTVMRTSLLPGLLHAVARARRHGERSASLFAVGSLFLSSGASLPDERLSFGALLGGDRAAWLGKPRPVDVWDAKGVAERLVFEATRRRVSTVAAAPKECPARLHPRGAAWIVANGDRVGSFGPLHPDVTSAFDVADNTMAVELDLDALLRIGEADIVCAPLPRFPASSRDMAVVVKSAVRAGDVELVVRRAAGEMAEGVEVFDRFVGGNVPSGHVSLAFRVVYRATDRTLTDDEVDERHARVVSAVQEHFNAALRS
jgi:phenylalanyl-tRNA synthetase beta chain